MMEEILDAYKAPFDDSVQTSPTYVAVVWGLTGLLIARLL